MSRHSLLSGWSSALTRTTRSSRVLLRAPVAGEARWARPNLSPLHGRPSRTVLHRREALLLQTRGTRRTPLWRCPYISETWAPAPEAIPPNTQPRRSIMRAEHGPPRGEVMQTTYWLSPRRSRAILTSFQIIKEAL